MHTVYMHKFQIELKEKYLQIRLWASKNEQKFYQNAFQKKVEIFFAFLEIIRIPPDEVQ